jgi:hypothetical protein
MEEQLISVETAILAKEKGFDVPVLEYYDGCDMLATQSENVFDVKNYNKSGGSTLRSAPSQGLLQRWLREVHDLRVSVVDINTGLTDRFYFIFFLNGARVSQYSNPAFDTYENTLEAGLLEALKHIK